MGIAVGVILLGLALIVRGLVEWCIWREGTGQDCWADKRWRIK